MWWTESTGGGSQQSGMVYDPPWIEFHTRPWVLIRVVRSRSNDRGERGEWEVAQSSRVVAAVAVSLELHFACASRCQSSPQGVKEGEEASGVSFPSSLGSKRWWSRLTSKEISDKVVDLDNGLF
jgi:hypothetical protein